MVHDNLILISRNIIQVKNNLKAFISIIISQYSTEIKTLDDELIKDFITTPFSDLPPEYLYLFNMIYFLLTNSTTVYSKNINLMTFKGLEQSDKAFLRNLIINLNPNFKICWAIPAALLSFSPYEIPSSQIPIKYRFPNYVYQSFFNIFAYWFNLHEGKKKDKDIYSIPKVFTGNLNSEIAKFLQNDDKKFAEHFSNFSVLLFSIFKQKYDKNFSGLLDPVKDELTKLYQKTKQLNNYKTIAIYPYEDVQELYNVTESIYDIMHKLSKKEVFWNILMSNELAGSKTSEEIMESFYNKMISLKNNSF